LKGKVGEQEFAIYAEVLQRVQNRLSALGLYQGEREPEFGEKTREAVVAFQRSNNLQPTGLPDQATLWRLLRLPDGSTAQR
jgi:peptidoglycan hydrolase-like protein with peptidoglycan-binding domain